MKRSKQLSVAVIGLGLLGALGVACATEATPSTVVSTPSGGDSASADTANAEATGVALGSVVESGGSRYTVHSIAPFEEPNPYMQPKAGNVLITIDVTQQALDEVDSANPLYFTLKDVENREYMPAMSSAEPGFHSAELAPGEAKRGFITFEIPATTAITQVLAESEVFGSRVVIASF